MRLFTCMHEQQAGISLWPWRWTAIAPPHFRPSFPLSIAHELTCIYVCIDHLQSTKLYFKTSWFDWETNQPVPKQIDMGCISCVQFSLHSVVAVTYAT